MTSPRAAPRRHPTRRQLTGRRRTGATAVIAMIFLVLFAALAVGFYAQTTISAQIGHNEIRLLHARTAAESGMEFMRYQLSLVQVPPLTPDDQVMDVVYKDLSERLECTGNLGSHLVYINGGATRIEVPEGEKNYISLYENGPRFRAIIKRKGRDLVVTTVGSAGPTATGSVASSGGRAGVELTFRADQERGSFFSYGLASQGAVTANPKLGIDGAPEAYAGVLSLGAVTIDNSSIDGEITVREGVTPTLVGAVSVAGETDPAAIQANHVNQLKAAQVPEFPRIDSSIFRKYATNTYVSGKAVYDNTLVPPNTNPTFNSGITIRGVLYIQQPNAVKFNGSVVMQCVVVTEEKGVGTLATNVISFQGNGGAKQPLSSLPNEGQFDELRDLTGSFLLAPGFDVQFTGNFGAVAGDIAGDRLSFGGSSDITVTGNIFTLKPTLLTISNNGAFVVKQDPNSRHSGVRHTENFVKVAASWREVTVP